MTPSQAVQGYLEEAKVIADFNWVGFGTHDKLNAKDILIELEIAKMIQLETHHAQEKEKKV